MSLAPLSTLDDVKLACRIDLTDSSLDGLLAALMAAADSIVQVHTGVPVTINQYTQTEHTEWAQPTASFSAPQCLILNRKPLSLIGFTVTDFTGSVVDPTTYTVDPVKGLAYANQGTYFGQGPYTIVYYAGLSAHPEWAIKYRAIHAQIVRDLCAWMYDQPNSGLKSEMAGGGVGQTYSEANLPPRVCMLLKALPGSGVSIGI